MSIIYVIINSLICQLRIDFYVDFHWLIIEIAKSSARKYFFIYKCIVSDKIFKEKHEAVLPNQILSK